MASLTGQKKITFFFSNGKRTFFLFSQSVDPLYRCSRSHFTRYGFSEAKVQCRKALIGRHRLVEVQCGRNIVPTRADSNKKNKQTQKNPKGKDVEVDTDFWGSSELADRSFCTSQSLVKGFLTKQ